MNLSGIQSYVAGLITGNSALSALGTPIKYSHFTSDEDARAAIDSALRANGVCIEIGAVSAAGDASKPFNRMTTVDAEFEVYVAESPSVTHTPSEMDLVALVGAVVQARADARDHNARCVHYEAAKSEKGYVLHVLSFTMPATLQ